MIAAYNTMTGRFLDENGKDCLDLTTMMTAVHEYRAVRISRAIAEWVGKNFGEQELDDPSWNIEDLAYWIEESMPPLF